VPRSAISAGGCGGEGVFIAAAKIGGCIGGGGGMNLVPTDIPLRGFCCSKTAVAAGVAVSKPGGGLRLNSSWTRL